MQVELNELPKMEQVVSELDFSNTRKRYRDSDRLVVDGRLVEPSFSTGTSNRRMPMA